MPGEGQHIDMHVCYVKRHTARSLRAVNHKKNPFSFREFTDLGNRHLASGHVRSRGNDNQLRIRSNRFFDVRRGEQPVPVRAKYGMRDTELFQTLKRPQYRIMFHARCNDMIAGTQKSLDA